MDYTEKKITRRLLAMMALGMGISLSSTAQNTTSSITGTTADDGDILPGAVVTVTETASGTTYSTVSNHKGQYRIDGVQPGGPYRMEVSYVGHKKSVVDIKRISLGEVYTCDVTLNAGNELAEVVIDGTASMRKTGASNHISSDDIARMPSISRSFSDITRLSPYALGSSFAGRDQGMNSYSIDGANFNSNMGLDREWMPTQNKPISIDAIEEMQVVTSAFDVKNSNFAGASINAVTKRGTNTFKGSAYTYFRNEDLRGNRVDHEDLGERAEDQRNIYGMTFGGPIIKDKLHFFVNAEYEHSPKPIHNWKYSTDGTYSSTDYISRVTEADMNQFASDLQSMYGWNPGSATDFNGVDDTYRLLTRLDWNINSRHHAMLRYNFTSMKTDNNVSSGGNVLLATSIYAQSFRGSTWVRRDKVHSLTAELNSHFSNNINNVLRAGFTFNDANNRESAANFPTINIMKADENGTERTFMNAGYDQHAYNNGINEKSWNITDDVTISLGKHFLTAGINYEHTWATNCYMRYGAGYYKYASYDDFVNKSAPTKFALCYSLTGDDKALSEVTYNTFSLYVQDEWNVNSRLRLLYGIRMDVPSYPGIRYENPSVSEIEYNGQTLNTGEWPSTKAMFSPRIGFNYDIISDGSLRLRGGTGIFTTRFPLIFLSKMQESSGMLQTTVNTNNAELMQYLAGGVRTPKQILEEVVPNLPDNLKKLFPTEAGATNNIATIDRNFKTPQIWKTTLAVDYKLPLPFDAMFTLEGTFAKDINAITIYDANIDAEKVEGTRFNGPDNRYYYPGSTAKRIYSDKGYAYVMTNTNKGYSANVVAQLNMKPVRNLDIMMAYTYTASKSMTSLTSNQIENAMTQMFTVNGYNYPELQNARTLYSPHRLVASASYRFNYAHDKMSTTVSLFYEGRRNGSYSYYYSNDMNNDGCAYDLIYIPATKDELTFKDQTVKYNGVTYNYTADEQKEAFWDYVNQDPYLSKHKGEYAESYAAYLPWYHRFDLRVTQEFKVKAGKTMNRFQINLDITNLGNLINSCWGTQKTALTTQPLKFAGVDENNTPTFNLTTYQGKLIDHSFETIKTSANCWQLQLGLRYYFN